MKKNVCIIGNVVADFLASPIHKVPGWGKLVDVQNPIQLNIGGNGGICSACIAKLGLKPYLVGKIGNDVMGVHLRNALNALGVDTKWLFKTTENATSTTLVLVNDDGERMFFHHFGSSLKLSHEDFTDEMLKDMSAVLLCSFFLLPNQ